MSYSVLLLRKQLLKIFPQLCKSPINKELQEKLVKTQPNVWGVFSWTRNHKKQKTKQDAFNFIFQMQLMKPFKKKKNNTTITIFAVCVLQAELLQRRSELQSPGLRRRRHRGLDPGLHRYRRTRLHLHRTANGQDVGVCANPGTLLLHSHPQPVYFNASRAPFSF